MSLKEATIGAILGVEAAPEKLTVEHKTLKEFVEYLRQNFWANQQVGVVFQRYLQLWAKATKDEQEWCRTDSGARKLVETLVIQETSRLRGLALYFRDDDESRRDDLLAQVAFMEAVSLRE